MGTILESRQGEWNVQTRLLNKNAQKVIHVGASDETSRVPLQQSFHKL